MNSVLFKRLLAHCAPAQPRRQWAIANGGPNHTTTGAVTCERPRGRQSVLRRACKAWSRPPPDKHHHLGGVQTPPTCTIMGKGGPAPLPHAPRGWGGGGSAWPRIAS